MPIWLVLAGRGYIFAFPVSLLIVLFMTFDVAFNEVGKNTIDNAIK